jgi:hypothetical protein
MSFFKLGKKKEKEFSEFFKNVGFSDKESDMIEHWDVEIKLKTDVKSLKRIKRSDVEPNEFYHYVELKNVKGELGWLYGEADLFAFETNEYWVLVDKNDLQDFIAKKTVKSFVKNPDESLHCLYRREGRKDVITMVKTLDLMKIAIYVFDKSETKKINHQIGDSIYPEIRIKKRLEKILEKKS